MTNENKPTLKEAGKIIPIRIETQSPKTLEMVLKYLEENDEYFECNVPEKYRDPEEDNLQNHLVNTYSKTEFEITGKELVKKHIKKYDLIEYFSDNPISKYRFYIKPGMRGIITKVDNKNDFPISALWESCEEYNEKQELIHNGTKLILFPSKKSREEKITDELEILALAKPGMEIQKTEESYKYKYHVPPGAKGIVLEINDGEKFPVTAVFSNCKDFVPTESGEFVLKYSGIKIFRDNKFDIKHLLTEKKYLN